MSLSQSEILFLMLSRDRVTRNFSDGDQADRSPAQSFALVRKRHALPADCVMGTIMGDVVNLKRFKKRAARNQSARQADANRARFGRTKSERVLDEQRASRASDMLDRHRIDGEDAS
jgi:hypothetical protein